MIIVVSDDALDDSVRARQISVCYRSGFFGRKSVRALGGVDLDALPGEVVGVVGPNGSGKSTLLRCLLGLTRCDTGTVTVLGRPAGAPDALRRIGYVSEGRLPFSQLTAFELLVLAATVQGTAVAPAKHRANELLALVELDQVASRAHRSFSTGMERRLAFAHALVLDPDLLVLDEPMSAMDPLGIDIVRRTLDERRGRAKTAVVATNGLDDYGENGFDRLIVLLAGEVAAAGTADDVLGPPVATAARRSLGDLLRSLATESKRT